MSSTIFSLLDLLASRFRSDSQNEPNQSQQSETESEPHSQPRSRSHTETSRPGNLPIQRSPQLPRQHRSMTTHDGAPFSPLSINNNNNNNNNNSTDNNNNNNDNNNNNNNNEISPQQLAALHILNNNNPQQNKRQNRRSSNVHGVPPGGKTRTNSLAPPKVPTLNLPNNSNNDSQKSPRRSPRANRSSTIVSNNNNILPTTTTTTTNQTDVKNKSKSNLSLPSISISTEPPTTPEDNNNEEPTTITIPVPETIVGEQDSSQVPPDTPTMIGASVGAGNDHGILTITHHPLEESTDPMAVEMQDFTQEEFYDEEAGGDYDNAEQGRDDEFDDVDEAEYKKEPPMPFSNKFFFKEILYYFGRLALLVLMVSTIAIGYGMFEIYAGCRFVDVDHNLWPKWGIVAHSISRIILNTALCMFPYVLLAISFGFKETFICLPIGIAASVGASAWATFNVVRPVLEAKLALLPSYFFFVVALLSSATYMGKKLKSHNFRHLFMGQFVLAAVALVVYDFFLIPFYIQTSSINKSVVRILIHPGICATALFVSRACSSRIRPTHKGTNVFPVLIFMWFSTYYGRFFNSNMSLGFMTGTMAIVSGLELIWRTTLRPRDKKIMNAICGFCFNRELRHSNNFDRIYRDFLRHEQMYENTSIITACAVYLAYYHVFDSSNFDYERILSSMAIQFALEWVTDLVSFYIESRVHKLDILYREKYPRGFYFMICYTFFLGMAYSTSRIILINKDKWIS